MQLDASLELFRTKHSGEIKITGKNENVCIIAGDEMNTNGCTIVKNLPSANSLVLLPGNDTFKPDISNGPVELLSPGPVLACSCSSCASQWCSSCIHSHPLYNQISGQNRDISYKGTLNPRDSFDFGHEFLPSSFDNNSSFFRDNLTLEKLLIPNRHSFLNSKSSSPQLSVLYIYIFIKIFRSNHPH